MRSNYIWLQQNLFPLALILTILQKLDEERTELLKQVNDVKNEIAGKKSELDTLYSDMDGVYQVQDKCVAAQKELETKLKQLEERFLQVTKAELQTRQELQLKTLELEDTLKKLRAYTDKVIVLEELKKSHELLLKESDEKISLLEREVEAKTSLATESQAEIN